DIVIEEAKPDTTVVKTEVVWEGIDKRYFPVIESSFEYLNVMNMVSDSTFLYLEDATLSAKNTTLKKANIYGKNIKEEFSFGKESSFHTWVNDTVYYLDAGKLKSYNSATSTRKEVTAELDYQYDKALLNQRVFEQAWGAFGSNFYDPDMHGKSWKKLYDFYRPYVDKARSINDIAEIINEMIGDVNASHTGFYPRVEGIRRSIPIAFLGVELDLANVLPEGVKVSIVYPTSRLGSFYKLKEGDLISHINEIKITASTPLDSHLAGKIGKKISLRLVKDGIVSDAVITGLSYSEAYNLWYKYFTNANRLKVELLSDSKLGYIHIPSMGNTDWSNFYTELFRDNYDKDALVIDVRGNTGGYIHDQIISLLLKKRYAYSKSRSLSHNLRYEPRRSWDKPTIVLVNEESFSDGEIFPTIYQELKLGKVVGTPSSGAVIGTWHYYLMDGSSMRMHGTGWYKLDGSNMEGSGAMPDIIVDNSPEDKIARRDPQLERAVKELLKELK
ncbi:MAG: S41 family peptidase, partial [Candidatus Cloacimonetes bacterium]|nr:S41 family peptidase [Candidatus Cloacimonadota bacterium]